MTAKNLPVSAAPSIVPEPSSTRLRVPAATGPSFYFRRPRGAADLRHQLRGVDFPADHGRPSERSGIRLPLTEWRLYCVGRDNDQMPGYPKNGTLRDVQRQEARVGDAVSNGVYAGLDMTVPACPEGSDRGQYEIDFRATSVDFHGNLVRSPDYHVLWNSFVWW